MNEPTWLADYQQRSNGRERRVCKPFELYPDRQDNNRDILALDYDYREPPPPRELPRWVVEWVGVGLVSLVFIGGFILGRLSA